MCVRLPASRAGISRLREEVKHHIARRKAHGKDSRQISVMGRYEVSAWLQDRSVRCTDRFMTSARDSEVGLAGPSVTPHLLIQSASEHHQLEEALRPLIDQSVFFRAFQLRSRFSMSAGL